KISSRRRGHFRLIQRSRRLGSRGVDLDLGFRLSFFFPFSSSDLALMKKSCVFLSIKESSSSIVTNSLSDSGSCSDSRMCKLGLASRTLIFGGAKAYTVDHSS